MNVRHQTSSFRILIVTFHKELSRFVIQTAFWEGVNQQASNNTQDVGEARVRSPILFQSVDADGSGAHVDVGMVDLGQKESPRRRGWELNAQDQFETEKLALVRCSLWSLHFGLFLSY